MTEIKAKDLMWVGKPRNGMIARFHVFNTASDLTWCGRRLRGVTHAPIFDEVPYNACDDCLAALRANRPRAWRRRR